MNTTTVTVVADPELPAIRISRDFAATPAQLIRAHTDPELFALWVGPADIGTTVDYWDARTGGSWRFRNHRGAGATQEEYGFHGCFHEVRPSELIVQTFTFEGFPDGVALERLVLEQVGGGRTRLTATSLVDSFEGRDAFLASGMEQGVNEGYESLDELLAG